MCNKESGASFHPDTSIEAELVHALRSTSRNFHMMLGNKSSQNRILQILWEQGSMFQRDLTEHLGIWPGSASELLRKMEAAGVLERVSSPCDHRTTIVSLTAIGQGSGKSECLHSAKNTAGIVCRTDRRRKGTAAETS